MKLQPTGRDHYRLGIQTSPAVNSWEASFDEGTTFEAPTPDGELFSWLVQGPDAPGGVDAITLPRGRTTPVLRAVDGQVIVVRDGPPIDVE